MALIHKTGNIFDTTAEVIGHGVNLRGLMGAGIAAQVRSKYPEVYKDYKKACDNGELRIGDVLLSPAKDGRIIANMSTQLNPGRDARLTAVDNSVFRTFKLLKVNGYKSIALPQIGSGIGGLDWDEVLAIIETHSQMHPDLTVEVWTYEP